MRFMYGTVFSFHRIVRNQQTSKGNTSRTYRIVWCVCVCVQNFDVQPSKRQKTEQKDKYLLKKMNNDKKKKKKE